MKNIAKIDISKITRTGKYVDFENSEIFNLTAEEIIALRRYHKNPNIAIDYDFGQKREEKVSEVRVKSREEESVPENGLATKRYAVAKDRSNKYNHGYKTKETPKIKFGYRVVIGSLIVILGVGMIWNLNTQAAGNERNNETLPPEEPSTSVSIVIDEPTDPLDGIVSTDETVIPTAEPEDNLKYEREIINKYADIYHINRNVAFNKLAELTDNFADDDFLSNYHITGVTCKGQEVYGSSEEEILLYAIRAIKQLPEQFGIDIGSLYDNNEYHSSTDYCAQINSIAKVMGVDRCLLYAICRTECNFKSELFLTANNPAGLRNNGSWWKFDTIEEGFIETCAEIIKYYRMIGKPLSDVSYNTLAEVGAIHAPVSDGNELWLDTVWEIYNEAKENELSLFGEEKPNNAFNY